MFTTTSPALAGRPEKIDVHQHAGKYEVSLLEDGRLIYCGFSTFFCLKENINPN